MHLLSAIITVHIFSKIWICVLSKQPLDISDEPTLSETPCNDDKACNKNAKVPEDECSVCAEASVVGERYCLANFINKIWYNDQCALPTQCILHCENNAACILGGGEYIQACLCEKGFADTYCTHHKQSDEKAVRMLQAQRTNAFAKPGEVKRFLFRLVGDVVKMKFPKMYKTGLGNVVNSDADSTSKGVTECFFMGRAGIPCADHYADLQLPYLPPNNEYGIELVRDHQRLKGYITNVHFRMRRSSREYEARKFNVFVNYEHTPVLECIPLIKLTNCGRTNVNASQFVFRRNVDVVIDYNVKYLKDGRYWSKAIEDRDCSANDDSTWTWTWSKQINRNYFGADKELQFKGSAIGHKRTFPKFTLDFGIYRVNLRIKRAIKGSTNENFDECFFQVEELPLKAVIEGGLTRQVIKESGITLIAKNSYDPNRPPQEQSIKIHWSCECLTTEIPNCQNTCKKRHPWISVNQEFFVPGGDLQYNAQYKFTLTVDSDIKYYNKKIAPQFSELFVKVANESVKGVINYYIMCIQNCGTEETLPNELLFLKAKTSFIGKQINKQEKTEFDWVYSKGEESVLNPIGDTMKLTDLPSNMLAIKEGTFESGVAYTIRLRVKNSEDVVAEYSFKTGQITYEGNCKVDPPSGIKGVTDFDIICDGFPSLIFEYYDKSEQDVAEKVVFNGRMLGTSEYSGVLKDVKITRGNIEVYIINKDSRLYIKKDLKVELSPRGMSEEIMNELRNNLTSVVGLDHISTTMNYISYVPDILPEGVDKGEMLQLLLEPIAKVTLDTVADVKISASTMKIVLQTLNKPTPIKVSVPLIGETLLIIDEQTNIIRDAVEDRDTSQWMSTQEIKLVATALLECLNSALSSENASTAGQSEESMGFESLFTLRNNAQSNGEILDKVKDILSYLQSPGLPPAKLATFDKKFQIWAMGEDEDYPISQVLEKDSEIPFSVSQGFLKSFSDKDINSDTDLFFQPALIENNIFSWSKSNVKSKLVSLSVATKKKNENLEKIKKLPSPIKVKIAMEPNITIEAMKGAAKQVDPHLSPVDRDIGIEVLRIDTLPKSFITIRFLYPPTNESLRVLVIEDYRPDYEMMTEDKQTHLAGVVIINSSNPVYPLRHRNLNTPAFLYMGILPGKDVPINKSVDYELEVTQNLCQRWIDGQWSTIGCTVSESTTTKETGCWCNHLSIFAAAFPVPPQEINPIDDAKLFLTVLDNPLVVVFVIILFIVYLLLILWGRYKDSVDRFKGKVVVLDDNFPEDEFPYLVAVHTSARFNAGTTAHVGIKLMGKEADSRAHILSSERRRVLTRNSDDWFMIYTPKRLGDIYGVHVWHDNYGKRAEWYCDKIVVYDLSAHVESLFIVEQWLALRQGDFPEAQLMIASDTDMLNIKRLFLDNSVIGFRDSHTFLSVLIRHPRSEVTRVQRVSLLMLAIMVAMLCSIMFYKPEDDDAPDEYEYDIGTTELIISVECLFITGALTLVVLLGFKRSYKVIQEPIHVTKQYRKDEIMAKLSRESLFLKGLEERRGKDKTFHDNYVKYVQKYFKEPPLAPVHMWDSEKKVQRRMFWYAIAWFACIIIIIFAAYFVMLYGLKLGFVQSQIWLTSLVMTMGEDIFVMGPGRIIFVAILLSMAFQVSTKVDLHGITVKDAMLARPVNDLNYLNILLAKRSHPMYAPLSSSARLALLRRKEIRRKWWNLIDFMNGVFFVVIVSAVIYRLWTSNYQDVSHLRSTFSASHLKQFGSVNIERIRNISMVERYLEYTFIEDMFNLLWYNKKELTIGDELEGIRKYWVDDYIQKPISTPLLTQVRVVPSDCKIPFFKNMSQCLLKWSHDNEDTNVYGENWIPATYSDTTKEDSPWEYKEKETFMWWTNQRFYGVFGRLYDVSGYNTFVGPTLKKAQQTLIELRTHHWQDWYTRACFLTTTVYNVNEQVFSQVTILFEYFVDGNMASSITVIPVSRIIMFGVWEYLFLFYAVYYVFRTGYLINRMGLMDYLKTLNNTTRIVNVFLQYTAILLWCVHHRTSMKYAENYMKNAQEIFFDFDEFISTFSLMQIVLSLLLCFVIARCFMLVRGGRRFLNVYYTLKITLILIFWLGIGFLLLIFFCRRLQYFLDCQNLFRMKELILPQKMTNFVRNTRLENNNVQVFISIRLFLMFFVHVMFVIFFTYYYRIAKGYKPRSSDDFNFVTFVIERVQRCFSRRKSFTR